MPPAQKKPQAQPATRSADKPLVDVMCEDNPRLASPITGTARILKPIPKPSEKNEPLATSEAEWARQISSARTQIESLIRKAKRGERSTLDALFALVKQYPEIRDEFHELVAFATVVEDRWIDRLAGEDNLVRRQWSDKVAELKAQLCVKPHGVAVSILASIVIVAYMSFHRVALEAAQPVAHDSVMAARERRLAAAQKQLQSAVKAWQDATGNKLNSFVAFNLREKLDL